MDAPNTNRTTAYIKVSDWMKYDNIIFSSESIWQVELKLKHFKYQTLFFFLSD